MRNGSRQLGVERLRLGNDEELGMYVYEKGGGKG